MHRILVTGNLDPEALEDLRAIPQSSVSYQPDISRPDLLAGVADYHVLLTRSGTAADRTLMDAGKSLKIIARAGVGIANIDLEYATQKGILVINAPGVNTQSAAELTLALLLAMSRKLPEAQERIKSGGWDRHLYRGMELRGKTMGLVGFGNVARRVAQLCQGFPMNVEAYDPYLAPGIFESYGVKRQGSMTELLRSCHILSVHVPLNEETTNLIDGECLKTLAQGSWVINTSRGGVVCESSLLELLSNGHLAGAAIDTWLGEPEVDSALVQHPKVYATPHIGAATMEAQRGVGKAIVVQIQKALAGEVVDHPVNIPGIHSALAHPMRAQMVLAEKIGRLAQQILEFQATSVVMAFPSSLTDDEKHLLTIAFQKGFLFGVSNEFISYANAATKFAACGISFGEASPERGQWQPSRDDSSMAVTLMGDDKSQLLIKGVVYDKEHPRITLLNEFALEVVPDGHFIVFKNKDTPGVVAEVGGFLASKNINIDSFYLSSHNLEGQAMAMVKIDRCLSKAQLGEMKSINFIESLFAADL